MKPILALLLSAALTGQAGAADCRLRQATYGQADSNWELRFLPVPRDAAANQVAAFEIKLPNSGQTMAGDVHIPNGYGSAWGAIGENCPPYPTVEEEEACTFWRDVIYAADADGMRELPHSDEDPAPQQVLLPKFASNVWYSLWRNDEWTDTQTPSDVFSFRGCANAAP